MSYDLARACESGALESVELLLATAPNPAEIARKMNNLALRLACEQGNLAVLERLLARDVGLTTDDARADNNFALRWACTYGHLGVVERLFARNPATPAFQGLTAADARAENNAALRYACANGHLGVVTRLFEAGLTADDARAADNQALREACARGRLEVVERLFEAGLTAADARQGRALSAACHNGHPDIVARLFSRGADGSAFQGLEPADAAEVVRRTCWPPGDDRRQRCRDLLIANGAGLDTLGAGRRAEWVASAPMDIGPDMFAALARWAAAGAEPEAASAAAAIKSETRAEKKARHG